MSERTKRTKAAIEQLPRVLVIESNPIVSTQLQQLMRGWGALTVPVATREAAEPLLEQQRFDLMFVSMQVPDLDAAALASWIRLGGINSTTPIIAMANAASVRETRRALEAGANDTLALPTSVRALARICWYWLKLDQYPKATPAKRKSSKAEA
jgi:two-component system sensor histidine kinase BarA